VRRRLLLTLVGILTAIYLALFAWDLSTNEVAVTGVIYALVSPTLVVGGVLLALKRPGHPIGELLLLCGIASPIVAYIAETPTNLIFRESGAQGWMWASIWLSQTSTMVALVLAAALVVLLPDGRPRHARERRFLRAAWIVVVLPTLALISNDLVVTPASSFHGISGIPSPLFVKALQPYGRMLATLNTLGFAIFLVAIALLFLRYHAATTRERKQIRWVLFAGFVVILVGVIPSMLAGLGVSPPPGNSLVQTVLSTLSLVLLPASVVAAVMEPHWIDVDIVIRRSVVYAALSVAILVVYIAVAVAVGVAAGAGLGLNVEVAVVLTVVFAILFQPARSRLQTLADRWVFGARPTKYEAVTEFGATIEQAARPTELLTRLVDTIRRVLRLEWVVAILDDGNRAEAGSVTGESALRVSVGAGDDQVGEIVCGPKTEGALGTDEIQLVRTLAGQLGLAVMNARLAGRIVNAAESERRRIERNIHDGAQQELVALVAKLGMARSAAAQGRLSPEVVNGLRLEAQQILADLRELAQGIHPSVLSDGGLLEAVEERCARLPIDVSLEAGGLRARRFDDNIEGAAYFFITESIANVLKHANATRAVVSLACDGGRLRLGVEDDGRGFDTDATSNHGLAGLTDRIRALGGTVTITSRPGEGTRIAASLPVDVT
jgi:signal transduction histidine kinase